MAYNVKEKCKAVIKNLKKQGCEKQCHKRNLGKAILEECNIVRESSIHKFVKNMITLGYLKETPQLMVFEIPEKK